MNILILGGGGREHALAWAVMQNPKCDRLIVAPGNAGIAAIARCADLAITDGAAVAAFCDEHAIDLVVIGPEAPLAAGVADALRARGVPFLFTTGYGQQGLPERFAAWFAARGWAAPVKAPRSCPKRVLSKSVSGTAVVLSRNSALLSTAWRVLPKAAATVSMGAEGAGVLRSLT